MSNAELVKCSRGSGHGDAVTIRGGMPLCGTCTVEVELAREAYLRGATEAEPDYYTTSKQEEAQYLRWCKDNLLDPEDPKSAVEYEVWYSDFYA
jgi:hypothetical protein